MSPIDMRNTLRKQPFTPFRLVMSDGSAYDVRHPEMVLVGLRTAFVGLMGSASETFPEQTIQLDLGHITQVVPIDAATPPARGAVG